MNDVPMIRRERPDWDTYFLTIAQAVSLRGDCTRRQVGAVLVKDNRIIGTGYNGAPPGDPGCLTDHACPRGQMPDGEVVHGVGYDKTGCIAWHAEDNAIAFAVNETQGATIYVTCTPCAGCAEKIEKAGIVRVVAMTPYPQQRGEVQ